LVKVRWRDPSGSREGGKSEIAQRSGELNARRNENSRELKFRYLFFRLHPRQRIGQFLAATVSRSLRMAVLQRPLKLAALQQCRNGRALS
jgi:hypothetical protein